MFLENASSETEIRDPEDLYNSIEKLEENTTSWRSRSVLTLDFSDGADTYVEHLTIDVDTEKVDECFVSSGQDHYYVLVGWRRKDTFLEFDCKANSGQSLQLMPLSFRCGYAEWSFLRLCESKMSGEEIPGCIRARVAEAITGSEDSSNTYNKFCSNHSTQCDSTWKRLLQDEEIRATYYLKIKRREPLILRASKRYDISILKLKERRNFDFPRRKLHEVLVAKGPGILTSRRATSTKIIAPQDVRVRSATLHDIQYESSYTTKLFGEGSWGHLSQKQKQTGEFLIWSVTFYPRRSYLVTPGLLILLLGLILCPYWHMTMQNIPLDSWNQSIVGLVDERPSFGFLFAYYIASIPLLFYKSHERSYLYTWIVRRIKWCLGIGMFVILLFPFIPHAIVKLAASFNVTNLHNEFIPKAICLTKASVAIYLIVMAVCFLIMFFRRKADRTQKRDFVEAK